MADKKPEETPATQEKNEQPAEAAEEQKKSKNWAEIEDDEEEDEKEVIPATQKKVPQPKRTKNAQGDYVITKIEIPDQPVLKEITKIRPVSSLENSL